MWNDSKNPKIFTVFLVYTLIRDEPGFDIKITTAHNPSEQEKFTFNFEMPWFRIYIFFPNLSINKVWPNQAKSWKCLMFKTSVPNKYDLKWMYDIQMISYNLSQKKFQALKFLYGTFWTQMEQTSHCYLGLFKSHLFQDVAYFMNSFSLDFIKWLKIWRVSYF